MNIATIKSEREGRHFLGLYIFSIADFMALFGITFPLSAVYKFPLSGIKKKKKNFLLATWVIFPKKKNHHNLDNRVYSSRQKLPLSGIKCTLSAINLLRYLEIKFTLSGTKRHMISPKTWIMVSITLDIKKIGWDLYR